MARSNVALRVKFLGIDGSIVAPILLIMLAPSWWLLYTLITFAVVLFILERKGISIKCLGRKMRTLFSGGRKLVRPPWRRIV